MGIINQKFMFDSNAISTFVPVLCDPLPMKMDLSAGLLVCLFRPGTNAGPKKYCRVATL